MRTPAAQARGACSRGAPSARCKQRIDPSEYGGAPLLGVKGCCVIGHGRSNAVAIKHGIRAAAEFFTQRRERAHRGRAARAGRAPRRPEAAAGLADERRVRLPRPGLAEGRAWAGRWPRPSRRAAPCSTRPTGALGFALSRLCFEGPEEELQLTANTQPAILTASIAACARAGGARPAAGLGGRATAWASIRRWWRRARWACADAVVAVRRRGQYMQEAVPVGEGAMAAILGLDLGRHRERLPRGRPGPGGVARQHQLPGPGRDRGHTAAVERAMERCKAAGAKRAMPLPVSAPFHCALMKPAQERLAARPGRASPSAIPRSPLVNNVDARVVRTGGRVPRRPGPPGLGRRCAGRSRWSCWCARAWTPSWRSGPGTVLAGLVKKIDQRRARAERRGPGVAGGDARRPGRRRRMTARPGRARSSLVTGASRGIGRAIAEALAARGRHRGPRRARRGEAGGGGGRDRGRGRPGARPWPSTWPTAPRWTPPSQGILETHGRLDHLVNNAGHHPRQPAAAHEGGGVGRRCWPPTSPASSTAPRPRCKPMLKQRSGRIVNVTSVVGLTGNAGQANYAASKAGLVGLHQVGGARGGLALHHRERGGPRLHRDRHDGGHDRQGARGGRPPPSPWAAWGGPRTWRARWPSCSRTPPPTSRVRCWGWTAASTCRMAGRRGIRDRRDGTQSQIGGASWSLLPIA